MPLVERFVRVFGDPSYDAVVSPSGSCVAMVREQYAALAREAGDVRLLAEAGQLAPRVFELTQFVADELGVEDVGATFPHRVTYHPACHSLRALGIGDAPLRLLRGVRGLELVELPEAESCCGFGGTFALKNADTSLAMLRGQARGRGRDGRRGGVRGRQLVPPAHRRRPLALRQRRAGHARGGDPGGHGMSSRPRRPSPKPPGRRSRTTSSAATSARRRPRSGPSARPSWRSCRTGRSSARPAGRSRHRRCGTSTCTSSSSSGASRERGGTGALGARRRRGERDRRGPRPRHRQRRGDQGQVARHRRDRPERRPRRGGHQRDRDGPRRADRAARPG